MKIAVTGHTGRLGSLLVSSPYEYYPIECRYDGNDVAVKTAIDRIKPDVVVHCAGYTDVDEAEMHPEQANLLNGSFAAAVREAFDGRMIYLSTDFIFGGMNGPYKEDDAPAPCCAYGRSKLLGEHILEEYGGMDTVIVRTTVLYGSPTSDKADFVKSVIHKLKMRREFSVPTKIIGSPTYIPHLAKAIDFIAKANKLEYSVINVSGSDVCSRYEFAQMIADTFNLDSRYILPCEYGYGIANRPKKVGMVLDRAKSMGIPIYSLGQGLVDMRRSIINHGR